MKPDLQVHYLHHSGFAVCVNDILLVFDDAQGISPDGQGLAQGRISRETLKDYAQVFIFASHVHEDHFASDIFSLFNAGNVSFILGYDIPQPYFKAHMMRPGDTTRIADVEITAYDSTDEGVSFLVMVDGWTLFHAGDLNLWHWREESSLKEIEQAEKAFTQIVEPLADKKIDIAFFPLDPRMGEQFDAGALYFLLHVKPRVMIPMHWWGRDDVAINFARQNSTKALQVVALTQPGQAVRAHTAEDGYISLA